MNKFEVRNMDLYYGSFHALKNINIDIPEKEITAFIGPSGCGKSTFLKSLNRMNDLAPAGRIYAAPTCAAPGKGLPDGRFPERSRPLPTWHP